MDFFNVAFYARQSLQQIVLLRNFCPMLFMKFGMAVMHLVPSATCFFCFFNVGFYTFQQSIMLRSFCPMLFMKFGMAVMHLVPSGTFFFCFFNVGFYTFQ